MVERLVTPLDLLATIYHALGIPLDTHYLDASGRPGSIVGGGKLASRLETALMTREGVVMGTAPLDGEYYNFTMPGFTVAGYPALSLVFSGNVFGGYEFVPLPAGVKLILTLSPSRSAS